MRGCEYILIATFGSCNFRGRNIKLHDIRRGGKADGGVKSSYIVRGSYRIEYSLGFLVISGYAAEGPPIVFVIISGGGGAHKVRHVHGAEFLAGGSENEAGEGGAASIVFIGPGSSVICHLHVVVGVVLEEDIHIVTVFPAGLYTFGGVAVLNVNVEHKLGGINGAFLFFYGALFGAAGQRKNGRGKQ